jgi:hypothetical protein
LAKFLVGQAGFAHPADESPGYENSFHNTISPGEIDGNREDLKFTQISRPNPQLSKFW